MIPYKYRSIVRVSEGPTKVYLFVCLSEDVENLPTVDIYTGSVCLVQDTGKTLIYHEDSGWEEWK